jgi:hypothetical protein
MIDDNRPDPAGEALATEFVDLVNAGDYEGLAELLHPDVSSEFLGTTGRDDVVATLEETLLRNPGVVFTRGELGDEPIAVAWAAQDDGYRRLGLVLFGYSEGDDGETLIERLNYEDREVDPDLLLAEEPDIEDADEGNRWSEWDSGDGD